MYNFFKLNRNVILMSTAVFFVSITTLLFFLTEQSGHDGLKANVMGGHASVQNDQKNDQKEEAYRAQIGMQEGPMVVIGLNGVIDFVSDEIKETYSLQDKTIKSDLYFNYIHPEDLPGVMASIGQVFEKETPASIIGPFRMKVARDYYSIFIGSLHPIFDSGKISKVAVILRDITQNINMSQDEINSSSSNDNEGEQIEVTLEEKLKEKIEFLELYNEFKSDIVKEIEAKYTEINTNDVNQAEEIIEPENASDHEELKKNYINKLSVEKNIQQETKAVSETDTSTTSEPNITTVTAPTPTPTPATVTTPASKPATVTTPASKPATVTTPASKPATVTTPASTPATVTTPTPTPATVTTPTPTPATVTTPTPTPATVTTPTPTPATATTPTPTTTPPVTEIKKDEPVRVEKDSIDKDGGELNEKTPVERDDKKDNKILAYDANSFINPFWMYLAR
jgi:hypothetical protein